MKIVVLPADSIGSGIMAVTVDVLLAGSRPRSFSQWLEGAARTRATLPARSVQAGLSGAKRDRM